MVAGACAVVESAMFPGYFACLNNITAEGSYSSTFSRCCLC